MKKIILKPKKINQNPSQYIWWDRFTIGAEMRKKIAEMTLNEIDQIDPHGLSIDQIMTLSNRKADLQYEIIRNKVDYEPRDWNSKSDEAGAVCGVMGECVYFIPHLRFVINNNEVVILGQMDGSVHNFECFKSRDKLDSFIDALIEAREIAFGS